MKVQQNIGRPSAYIELRDFEHPVLSNNGKWNGHNVKPKMIVFFKYIQTPGAFSSPPGIRD